MLAAADGDSAIPITRASSAFRTTRPEAGTARTSALFSATTPSIEPSSSRWAGDTVVTTASVGAAIAAR